MSLDPIECVVVDIVRGGVADYLTFQENVLGFYLDKDNTNLGALGGSYSYVEENVRTVDIAGTYLCYRPDTHLIRSYTASRSNTMFYPKLGKGATGKIGMSLLYTGRILLVTEVLVHDETLKLVVDYVTLLLRLYRYMLGTRMGLQEYVEESISFIRSIVTISYVPVSCSYPDILLKMLEASHKDLQVSINPKHDGVSCWVYGSPDTPMSLVSHTRHSRGFSYRYCGRLEILRDMRPTKAVAIFCEMLVDGNGISLKAIDAFTTDDMKYSERREMMKHILPIEPFRVTTQYLDRYTFEATGTRLIPQVSIHNAMSVIHPRTDGYVIYIDGERPVKSKLGSTYTLDLEYKYKLIGKKTQHMWNYSLPVPMQDPLEIWEHLDEGVAYVIEVRIHDGKIIRLRNDRTRGNSREVIDSVLVSYVRDSKYSVEDVLKGEDIRSIILLNRMFKYHCYLEYIPRSSRLIDMGSGNGADSNVWRDMGYYILAIELDKTRVSVLRSMVKSNDKVQVVRANMLDVTKQLHKATMRYTYATFMRTIGNLRKEEIVAILRTFRRYGVSRVVIVTMIRDKVTTANVSDTSGNNFSVSVGSGDMVTVSYSISGKPTTYIDRCYSLKEWYEISAETGYEIVVEYQWDILSKVYGIVPSAYMAFCAMDVGIVLSISGYT